MQGDYLKACLVPVVGPNFPGGEDEQTVGVKEYDLIVITQSCDLLNDPAHLVALCPVYPTSTYEQSNPGYAKKGRWEQVRKGREPALCWLPYPPDVSTSLQADASDPSEGLVVSFREIYSLPFAYLQKHASDLGSRWRLESPYLEHFSQRFGNYFMRVALP